MKVCFRIQANNCTGIFVITAHVLTSLDVHVCTWVYSDRTTLYMHVCTQYTSNLGAQTSAGA